QARRAEGHQGARSGDARQGRSARLRRRRHRPRQDPGDQGPRPRHTAQAARGAQSRGAGRRGDRPSAAPRARTDVASEAASQPRRGSPEVTSMLSEELRTKLDALPPQPGVYLMSDKAGQVVYVGKAASLRARVNQYFQPRTGDERAFIPFLEDLLGDIEVMITPSEKDALLLENELIKKHRPRFN